MGPNRLVSDFFSFRALAASVLAACLFTTRSARAQSAPQTEPALEGFLLLTALLLQSPGTAGLILAAKAIARYPECKSEHFAEYFLIGTLLSFSIAVLGGAILAPVVLGHFASPDSHFPIPREFLDNPHGIMLWRKISSPEGVLHCLPQ